MDALLGTYKFVKDDGKFGAFLQELKVGIVVRKMAETISPKVEIVKNSDGTYSIKTVSTFKNSEFKFKLGEECDETRMDGAKIKTVVTVDGNKITQKSSGEPPFEIVREFDGNKMTTTCKANDAVCVREYIKE